MLQTAAGYEAAKLIVNNVLTAGLDELKVDSK